MNCGHALRPLSAIVLFVAFALAACAPATKHIDPTELRARAMRMPAQDLGREVLSATTIVRAAEAGHKVATEWRQSGSAGAPPVATGAKLPDGTDGHFKPASVEEWEQRVTMARTSLEAYRQAIMQRGFRPLAKSYDLVPSRGCSEQLGAGEVTVVKQADYMLELRYINTQGVGGIGRGLFDAAVVETTVSALDVFALPGFPYVGELRDDRLVLRATRSQCVLTLTPK